MRLDVLELRHRPFDVDRRRDLRGEPLARQVERGLIVGDRIGKQLGFGVETAQANIGAREFGVQFEPRLRERVGAGFGVGVRRLDRGRARAPRSRSRKTPPARRSDWRRSRSAGPWNEAGGCSIACCRRGCRRRRLRDRGRTCARCREGARLIVRGEGRGEVRVGCVDLGLEIVERPVVEAAPPQTRRVERAVARGGRLLVLRRQRHRRRLVIGREIAPAERAGPRTPPAASAPSFRVSPHRLHDRLARRRRWSAPAGAASLPLSGRPAPVGERMRTSSPSSIESGGLAITRSLGRQAAGDLDLGSEIAADLDFLHRDAIVRADGRDFDRLVAKNHRARRHSESVGGGRESENGPRRMRPAATRRRRFSPKARPAASATSRRWLARSS